MVGVSDRPCPHRDQPSGHLIRVSPPAEPTDFQERCRTPGEAWLSRNPDLDPHGNPLWTASTPALRTAFANRCGLLAIFISDGHVDHWKSLRSDRTLAYEWSNYRYLSGPVNTAKKPAWEGKLLDPFEVGTIGSSCTFRTACCV